MVSLGARHYLLRVTRVPPAFSVGFSLHQTREGGQMYLSKSLAFVYLWYLFGAGEGSVLVLPSQKCATVGAFMRLFTAVPVTMCGPHGTNWKRVEMAKSKCTEESLNGKWQDTISLSTDHGWQMAIQTTQWKEETFTTHLLLPHNPSFQKELHNQFVETLWKGNLKNNFREVVKKTRYFYGQADRKGVVIFSK